MRWPATFGDAGVTDTCALLSNLWDWPPEQVLDFYSAIDGDTANCKGFSDWCFESTSLKEWIADVETRIAEIDDEDQPSDALILQVCQTVIIPSIHYHEKLLLRNRQEAEAAVENLSDAVSRYADQMSRTGLVDNIGASFAEALDDPGFAPLGQEDRRIRDSIIICTPMKLLELGWRVKDLVLLDLCDSTWVSLGRRPLSDPSILGRDWVGGPPTPTAEYESAVAHVCTVLRKLLFQVESTAYLATCNTGQSGDVSKGNRLHSAIRQSALEVST